MFHEKAKESSIAIPYVHDFQRRVAKHWEKLINWAL